MKKVYLAPTTRTFRMKLHTHLLNESQTAVGGDKNYIRDVTEKLNEDGGGFGGEEGVTFNSRENRWYDEE